MTHKVLLGVYAALFVLGLSTGSIVYAQTKAIAEKPALTEVQRLRAENFQLRVALAQAKAEIADRDAKLASFELSAAQVALVEDFRKTLGAPLSARFDWATLTFTEEPKK